MCLLTTEEQFEQLPDSFFLARSPSDRWAAMERIRQIVHNYKPGELKMVPVMEMTERNPDGSTTVLERTLRKKDGTFVHWKNPTESLDEIIEKYYPDAYPPHFRK